MRSTRFWNVTQHTFVATFTFKGQAAQQIFLNDFIKGLISRPETSVATYQYMSSRAKILFTLRRKFEITHMKP